MQALTTVVAIPIVAMGLVAAGCTETQQRR